MAPSLAAVAAALFAVSLALIAVQAAPEGGVLPPAAAAPAIVVHSFGDGRSGKDGKAVALGALEIRRLLAQLAGPGSGVFVLRHQAVGPEAIGAAVDRALAEVGTRQHVFVATATHPAAVALARHNASLAAALASLTKPDAHLLHSVGDGAVLCAGKTGVAALYAAYSLAEELGAGFYLHGEVLPSPRPSLTLPPRLYRTFTPRFATRGIQPFHDFPMGPDWWQLPYWKALASNMAKMKLNFMGFHTYAWKQHIVEPLVWIGEDGAGNFDPRTGDVTEAGAYQSSWFTQQDFFATPTPGSRDGAATGEPAMRGNVPGQVSRATSNYCCGASLAFERDCYGSDAQAAFCYPNTTAEAAALMNNAKDLVNEAFAWAEDFAFVSGAVGVEFPISRPPPASNATLLEVYTGMFARLVASGIPLSTFWLWTTEDVEDHGTGRGYPQSNPLWQQLVAEIKVAQQALKAVGANFTLGTNGWTVGPGDNASFFSEEIKDPSFTISAINGALGWLPPDPAFAEIGTRGWSIPWMEDDMSLASEELWVNRTLQHGALAHQYGTRGLLGLLWRTWETAPQIKALALAGWDETAADLTASGLFTVFCTDNFGPATAAECTRLFVAVDGTAVGTDRAVGRLPRDGQSCCGGPMSAVDVPASNLLDVSGFEAWLPTVTGTGNVERATQWVNLFRYHRQTQVVSNASAALDTALATSIKDNQTAAVAIGVPLARAVSAEYRKMVTLLLEYGTTPGTLGMLGAHEGANWPSKFGYSDPEHDYPCLPSASISKLAEVLAGTFPPPPPPSHCHPAHPDLTNAQCHFDNSTSPSARCMPYTISIAERGLTQEMCAGQCAAHNYSFAGVEFGVACFCGDGYPTSATLPMARCAAMKCGGNPGEDCGSADVVLVYPFTCSTAPPAPPAPPPSNFSGLIPALLPNGSYTGTARMYQPAVRTAVSRAEATDGLLLRASVLSFSPPTAVMLWLCPSTSNGACTQHSMSAAVDQWTQKIHSQVYEVRVAVPAQELVGFEYWMSAVFQSGGGPALRTPVSANTTVTVL